jgi:hypothetical protein
MTKGRMRHTEEHAAGRENRDGHRNSERTKPQSISPESVVDVFGEEQWKLPMVASQAAKSPDRVVVLLIGSVWMSLFVPFLGQGIA